MCPIESELSGMAGSHSYKASAQSARLRGHTSERLQVSNHARAGHEGSPGDLCETRAGPFGKAEGKENAAFRSCES